MKRITKKPWFGPRELLGWGWSPITWQGWLLTLFFIGLDVLVINYFVKYGVVYSIIGSLAVIVALFIAVVLTSDKPNFVGFKGRK